MQAIVASRKRSAAMVQEEAGLSEEECSTSPTGSSRPASRARKIRRVVSPPASQGKGTIGDLVGGGIPKPPRPARRQAGKKLNDVADVLDHNASTDEDSEGLVEQQEYDADPEADEPEDAP